MVSWERERWLQVQPNNTREKRSQTKSKTTTTAIQHSTPVVVVVVFVEWQRHGKTEKKKNILRWLLGNSIWHETTWLRLCFYGHLGVHVTKIGLMNIHWFDTKQIMQLFFLFLLLLNGTKILENKTRIVGLFRNLTMLERTAKQPRYRPASPLNAATTKDIN